MSKPEPHIPIPRNTPQARKGLRAFRAGEPEAACPYPSSHNRRTGWFAGYLDGRVEEKIGPMLAEHGIEYAEPQPAGAP